MEMENDIAKQSQEIPFFVNTLNYLFLSGDIEGRRETEARARALGSGDCSPVTDLEFVKQFTQVKLSIALDSTDKFHYNPITHVEFVKWLTKAEFANASRCLVLLLTNSNAALSQKTLDLENTFRKKEFQLKKDLDERERELKIDLLKFRREKAYEKYKGTCISVERYKPTEKDLVPVCRKCVELPDNPKREEEGLQPSQNSSPKIR